MVYMIAAYGVIWLLTLAFVATVFARQRRLQRDLELMEQLIEAEGAGRPGT
jgi:CcmD family protein